MITATREEMIELYHGQGLTQKQIGERFGVQQAAVNKWMFSRGIKARSAIIPVHVKVTTGYTVSQSGCWVWHRNLDAQGYGRVWQGRKRYRAHRVSYENAKGPIPDGLVIDHICRNRACINPDHLRAVTPTVNATENTESIFMKKKWQKIAEEGAGRANNPSGVFEGAGAKSPAVVAQ